jgi:hypothetical protein
MTLSHQCPFLINNTIANKPSESSPTYLNPLAVPSTHVIEPEATGPPNNSPRINRALPHPPPRVATPEPRRRSLRVSPTLIEEEPRYPKRHIIPREHTANLVTTMLTNNHDDNVDRAFQPKITTNTEHWACSIIDPDTGATMEY